MSFYHLLKNMLKDKMTICPKVRMIDLMYVPGKDSYTYMNKVIRKHVDFVLCKPQTMEPLLAIELDDASHSRSDRIERDNFVNDAFEAAGIPLIHFDVQRSYDTRDVGQKIKQALSPTPLFRGPEK